MELSPRAFNDVKFIVRSTIFYKSFEDHNDRDAHDMIMSELLMHFYNVIITVSSISLRINAISFYRK